MAIRIDGTNTTANPGITGADADTGLQFGTNELKLVTGGTEAVKIDSNQKLTASQGVLFGTDTAAANTLDDYEEGTWTPTIAGTSTVGTASYNFQHGSYEKIGRQVTVRGFVDFSSATGTGSIRIQGLPYTSNSASFDFIGPGPMMIGDIVFPSGKTYAQSYISNGVAEITPFCSGSNSTYTTVPMEAAGKMIFSLTYAVA